MASWQRSARQSSRVVFLAIGVVVGRGDVMAESGLELWGEGEPHDGELRELELVALGKREVGELGAVEL